MPVTALLLAATFSLCSTGPRIDCVVDGDTFWIGGEKVRIADINTPETHHAQCRTEKERGKIATKRLVTLLNLGPFAMQSGKRDRDRYGRLLRTIARGGISLGEQLVEEGLAERWKGSRRNWCV